LGKGSTPPSHSALKTTGKKSWKGEVSLVSNPRKGTHKKNHPQPIIQKVPSIAKEGGRVQLGGKAFGDSKRNLEKVGKASTEGAKRNPYVKNPTTKNRCYLRKKAWRKGVKKEEGKICATFGLESKVEAG